MEEKYRSNSHKARAERAANADKKVEKVISGKAVARKKTNVDKVLDTFISDEARNLKEYAIMEVLVPSIKNAISDIVSNGISMILFGDTSHTPRRSESNYVPYSSYRNGSNTRTRDRNRNNEQRHSSKFDYEDIALEREDDALSVLDNLDKLIDVYGHATIQNLYESVGWQSVDFTDSCYGWKNLRDATTYRTRDGRWGLKIPRPIPIS